MYVGSKHVHFDVEDKEKIKGFALGDDVTVTIKGKVCGLTAPEEPPEGDDSPCCSCAPSKGWPGSVKVELESIGVNGKNVFTEMADDEEEE